MTHRRKHYCVYPPGYTPSGPKQYKIRHSRYQAFKLALRLGVGAEVWKSTQSHPKRHAFWDSSDWAPLWTIEKKGQANG